MTARHKSEQGAILIYVAVVILVLVGVTMWVVDYGVLLVARNQAQNSADAGALGGAIAMAYDDFADRTDTGAAKLSAHTMALANDVIAEDPIVDITTDVYFYPDDPTKFPAVCADDSCIRVDVYRNQARGNPLQMFFGATVGLTEQGVWATAIAHAGFGNASDCMLPFGIPDKWDDNYDTTTPIDDVWTLDDTFQKADEIPVGATPDVYIAPSDYLTLDPVEPNTGFNLTDDLGQLLVLKAGGPGDAIAPGVYFPIRLTMANPDDPENPVVAFGAADFRYNIENCNGVPIAIGDTLDNEPGGMIGPTKQGMQTLYDRDPLAQWDPVTNSVINSCAQDTPSCGPKSPRLRPLILFDTGVYYDGKINGLVELTIANIIGFFINEISGNEVSGFIATLPGLSIEGAGNVAPENSFIKIIELVR